MSGSYSAVIASCDIYDTSFTAVSESDINAQLEKDSVYSPHRGGTPSSG